MKRLFIIHLLVFYWGIYGYSQLIADHTVVDQYDQIPEYYINEVKKMMVDIAGESHSLGYRIAMDLLETLDDRFQVSTYDSSIPEYSDQYLRLGRHASTGEADFYTSQSAIDNYNALITSQNNSGNPYSVMGFGWCWDMTWQNDPGGTIDPVHNVHWAGSSEGGPEGSMRWGLDADDYSLTGNSVSMDTYLDAVRQYMNYVTTQGYATKMIFTTGPVDDEGGITGGTENGFQRELKHDYIRNYVAEDANRILFDYADILCWNNSNQHYMIDWNDGGNLRSHAHIHPDNMMDYDDNWNIISFTEDGDHIGEVGALRLAKAMWWMLARIAGWDGISTDNETHIVNTSNKYFISNSDIVIELYPNNNFEHINVYSINGVCIYSKEINDDRLYFDISSLNSGVYIISLTGNNIIENKKIIL